MSLAAVLLNYNDARAAIESAERLCAFSCIDRVIIVDNKSTDGSEMVLREYVKNQNLNKTYGTAGGAKNSDVTTDTTVNSKINTNQESNINAGGRVVLVENERNGGYGYGNNAGVRKAAELGMDYCLIANPDTVFEEKAVLTMLSAFGNNECGNTGNEDALNDDVPDDDAPNDDALNDDVPDDDTTNDNVPDVSSGKVAAAGALMLSGTGDPYSEAKECAWPLMDFWRELWRCGPVMRRIKKEKINYSNDYLARVLKDGGIIEADVIHGALLMVDVKSFVAAGGYDENIFLYSEERVLARRLKAAGFNTVLTPAVYSHGNSETMKRNGLGLVWRERERLKSEKYYYRTYLKTTKGQQAFTALYQAVVMLETMVGSLFIR